MKINTGSHIRVAAEFTCRILVSSCALTFPFLSFYQEKPEATHVTRLTLAESKSLKSRKGGSSSWVLCCGWLSTDLCIVGERWWLAHLFARHKRPSRTRLGSSTSHKSFSHIFNLVTFVPLFPTPVVLRFKCATTPNFPPPRSIINKKVNNRDTAQIQPKLFQPAFRANPDADGNGIDWNWRIRGSEAGT